MLFGKEKQPIFTLGGVDDNAGISTYVRHVSLVALAYYLAGKFSLLFAIPPGYAVAVWPAAGIAFACVLCYGYRVWLGVMLGSAAVNLGLVSAGYSGDFSWFPYLFALGMGSAAALQAMVAATLVRRFAHFPNQLTTVRAVLLFFLYGAILPCFVAATLSVTLLSLTGQVAAENVIPNWVTWWFGDALGVLIAAPIALVWLYRPSALFAIRRWVVTFPMLAMFGLTLILLMLESQMEIARLEADFAQKSLTLQSSFNHAVDDSLQELRFVNKSLLSIAWINHRDFQEKVTKSLAAYSGTIGFKAVAETQDGESGFDQHGPVMSADEPAIPDQVLQNARDTGQLVISGRPTTAQSSAGFPVIGYAVLAVYRPGEALRTLEDRRRAVVGYLYSGLQGRALILSTVQGQDTSAVAYRILDQSTDASNRVLLASAAEFPSPLVLRKPSLLLPGVALASHEARLVGGRQWAFEVVPTQAFFAMHRTHYLQLGQLLSLVLTLVVGAFVMVVSGRINEQVLPVQ